MEISRPIASFAIDAADEMRDPKLGEGQDAKLATSIALIFCGFCLQMNSDDNPRSFRSILGVIVTAHILKILPKDRKVETTVWEFAVGLSWLRHNGFLEFVDGWITPTAKFMERFGSRSHLH